MLVRVRVRVLVLVLVLVMVLVLVLVLVLVPVLALVLVLVMLESPVVASAVSFGLSFFLSAIDLMLRIHRRFYARDGLLPALLSLAASRSQPVLAARRTEPGAT